MSMRPWAAVAMLLLGCPGGGQGKYTRMKVETTATLIDELLEFTTTKDDRGIAHMLATPLGYGGVWFATTECRRKFSGAGLIPESGIDLFASCVAGLPLVRSPRTHLYPDVAVFTYEPGMEIEALFDPADGGHIAWMGFAGRRDLKDALPTVTEAALLALRNEVPPLVIDEATRAEIDRELAEHGGKDGVHAWFKVCVDATGAVSGVHARLTSSVVAQDAFAAWIKTWSFQSFKLGDQPSPVCALIHVDEPPGSTQAGTVMPPPVPPEYADTLVVTEGSFGPLLAGEPSPHPDLALAEKIRDQPTGSSATTVMMFCVGDIGATDAAIVMRPSGVPDLDKLLVTTVKAWRFAPFVVRGNPVRACSHHVFRYEYTVPAKK